MEWTTADGQQIDISDMTTEHLKNTISMLRRAERSQAFAADACAGVPVQGDAAMDAMESAMCEALYMCDHLAAIRAAMVDELSRRDDTSSRQAVSLPGVANYATY
jgi:hypothetical protein